MAVQEITPVRAVGRPAARPEKGRLRLYDRTYLWVSRVILWAVILLTILPLYSVVIASLSPGDAFVHPRLIPDQITFANYAKLFAKGVKSDFVIWVKNTFLLGAFAGIVTSAMTVMAAYAISRMRFAGRKYGLMALLLLQMFPASMSVAAYIKLLAAIGGYGQIWGLALVYIGTGAFNIWLMKNYIDSIPRELDEAAKVDGATPWIVVTRIIIPLAKPMIVVQFLWSFMGVLNDFVLAKILIRSKLDYTLPVGLKTYTDQFATKWGEFAAAAILACIPVMIIWFINQKWVQQGLTSGAVKG